MIETTGLALAREQIANAANSPLTASSAPGVMARAMLATAAATVAQAEAAQLSALADLLRYEETGYGHRERFLTHEETLQLKNNIRALAGFSTPETE